MGGSRVMGKFGLVETKYKVPHALRLRAGVRDDNGWGWSLLPGQGPFSYGTARSVDLKGGMSGVACGVDGRFHFGVNLAR
jgi:hypothetical protein